MTRFPAESAAVQLAGHTDTVACVAIDPSGEVLATGGMDGVTRLWDVASGELKDALEGPTEAVEWLDWHAKGTILAIGSQDMTAWMFNSTSARCMQVFTGHSGAVMAGEAQMLLCARSTSCMHQGALVWTALACCIVQMHACLSQSCDCAMLLCSAVRVCWSLSVHPTGIA